jgi:AcrR family transcriptional regulator
MAADIHRVSSRAAASTAPSHEALIEELVPAEEALVRAAYRLIASKGIERTTLQDITDAAGVSKALAIYYFKTKENLLLATIRWVLGGVAERMTGVVASVEAPEEKVHAMVDAIFVDPRRNRDFYLAYTALIGEAARNERFNELNVTFRSIMNAAYADLIRSGEGTVFVVDSVEEAAGAQRRALPAVARRERLDRAPRALPGHVYARDPPLSWRR